MHHARDVDKAGGAATAAATPEEHVAPAVVVATVVGGGGTGGTGDTGALETYPTVLTGGTGLYRLWLMEKAVQTLAWCSASTSSHAAPQYHSTPRCTRCTAPLATLFPSMAVSGAALLQLFWVEGTVAGSDDTGDDSTFSGGFVPGGALHTSL